jgi:hypothetical protein
MKELNTFRQYLTEGVIKEDQISPEQLEDMGYSAGEKAVMALDTELFNQPYFDQYADGFIKGFQDNVRAGQDYAANSVAEGEIKEDYKNDYANSEEDFTDEMVVQKIKDIIKYHELDPQDLIDEIRIEFGVDAMN